MADTLHLSNMALRGVYPQTQPDGTLTALDIDVGLEYADSDGGEAAGRIVRVDVWSLLSETQKANMQDISNTISTYLVATYMQ